MSGIMAMMLGAFPSELTDPYFQNTVLLLHGDGTNGAQNNTFLDSSSNNFTITRNGNPTQGTFSPFSKEEGKWGVYFDGTGDGLSTTSNAVFNFGTGSFTVEAWVNKSGNGASSDAVGNVVAYIGNGTQNAAWISVDDSGYVRGKVGYNGAWVSEISSTATLANGTWYHVAIVRNGTALTLYIDGSSVASTTNSTDLSTYGTNSSIGYQYTLTRNFNGYISNLRVVKGRAVYTGNFTPSTTPLGSTSGGTNPPQGTETSLLCCQSNRFKDNGTANSGSGFPITAAGHVAVTPFSPFANSAAYSAATNGGSGYFDGSGDWLGLSSGAFELGTNDFTVDFYLYLNSLTANSFVCSGDTNKELWMTSGGEIRFYWAGVGSPLIGTATLLVPKTWYHIAFVRTGNTFKVAINGVFDANTGSSSSALNFGSFTIGGVSGRSVDGYMSNIRVIPGVCVYSGTFTPPNKLLGTTCANSSGSYPSTTNVNTSSTTAASLLTNFTNAGIIDNTGFNDLETVGNAQISTSVKKYGTGSLAFDGTGDYLTTPSINLSGDFTIEFWVYQSISGQNSPMFGRGEVTSSSGIGLYIDTAQQLSLVSGTADGGGTATVATWHHVAAVRSGSVIKAYLNGSFVGGGITNSSNLTGTSTIGRILYSSVNYDGYGYIDDLRITSGIARYTGNFTPPIRAFPDR